MTDNKTDQYWLTAAADIRRFCKGEINAAALENGINREKQRKMTQKCNFFAVFLAYVKNIY